MTEQWVKKYPQLFERRPASWGSFKRRYTLQLTFDLPSDDLVVNVRLIPISGGGVVVCRTVEDWRTLPGGSREQGETLDETVARELMEEAGCALTGPVNWFASFTVTNPTDSEPWRSWHPFPVSAWLVGVAPVQVVGPPGNPADGEHVVDVQTLSITDAIGYLSRFDSGGHAQLVALARDLGLLTTSRGSGSLGGNYR